MYAFDHKIGFVDAGADGRLRLVNAMSLMMNCCQFQEYQEVNLCNYLRSNGILIFLYSIQVDIFRLPQFRETVTTAVKIYGCRSIYGLRRLTMRDESGELCLIANATGAFFSIREGKALKVDPADLGVQFDEPEEMEVLPRKIPTPRSEEIVLPDYTVTRSRLDPNGHLTSQEYLAVAEDRLPEDFTFNRFRIEYKQQAKAGETIHPVLHHSPDMPQTKVIDLRSGNGLSCAVVEFSTR